MSKSIADELKELAEERVRIDVLKRSIEALKAAAKRLEAEGKAIDSEIAELRAKVANADGWIEWKGGVCPVDAGVQVDIKLASGKTLLAERANEWLWGHMSPWITDKIIAYRLAEPAADPERPKTWRLLLDTLKRQGEELKRKDTIILAAHQQRDYYRELAANAENRIRQLEANLEGEKALSAARGDTLSAIARRFGMTVDDGGITFYDNYGEIQSAADGDGATMFDLLGK